GSSKAHGEALGADEVAATKAALGWDPEQHFLIPEAVREHFDQRERGGAEQETWQVRFDAWAGANPELAAEWRDGQAGKAGNGLALHGGIVKPYGSTFFVFTDYMRPSIRLSALMELDVLWVLTHDSVAVGEDGPTHQPVEHLAALRAIPGLTVIRPADANE